MKERMDFNLVCRLAKRGYITEQKAKQWLALPLMVIDNRLSTPAGLDFHNYKTNNGEKQFLQFIPSEKTFTLDECMVYSIGEEAIRYGYIRIINDEEIEVEMYVQVMSGDECVARFICTFNDKYPNGVMAFQDFNGKPFALKESDRPWLEAVGNNYVNALLIAFQMFCLYNNKRDRYLMSVRPEKKPSTLKTGKKGKLSANIGPNIIYLNEFPKDHSASATGDGCGVEPHKRRGHHYTLRAERFKNHPLYQVENVLWKKPIWVGDRTRIVNGNVYTVLDE